MTQLYQSDREIEELVQSFLQKTLDKSLWTHAAHLTTAIWHLKQYDIHEATCRMKSAIISYRSFLERHLQLTPAIVLQQQ